MAWIDQLPSATATRAYTEHRAAAGSALAVGRGEPSHG